MSVVQVNGKMAVVKNDMRKMEEKLERNQRTLKELLNRVAKCASDDSKYIDNNPRETIIAIANDKITGKLSTSLSKEQCDDVNIMVRTLYNMCADDTGKLAFIRRRTYVAIAYEKIIEILKMDFRYYK